MSTRFYLPLCLIASFGSVATAADLRSVAEAIEDGRASDIVETLVGSASDGDADAQTLLAQLYQRGDGVARNPERAVELYRAAAEQGHAEAQFNLGNMYLLGEGVKADEAWALTYYRQAAAQGHELAQRNMVQLYKAAGMDPPPMPAAASQPSEPETRAELPAEPDLAEAPPLEEPEIAPTMRLGEQADEDAEQHPEDQAGDGVDEPVEAGDERPAETVAEPEAADPLVPEADVPDSVAESEVSTDGSAEQGDTLVDDEQAAIRMAQSHGIDVELPAGQVATTSASVVINDAPYEGDSLDALRRAADGGNARAQFELGNRFLAGAGVEPDDAMAITLYREAARRGHAGARKRLAGIYADAGLPLPDLGRPREPVAPASGPTTPAVAAQIATAVTKPVEAATEPVAVMNPEPTVAPKAVDDSASVEPTREPYEYAVIDHDAQTVPSVSADEIEGAVPDNHTVIAGGTLAQETNISVDEPAVEAMDALADDAITTATVDDRSQPTTEPGIAAETPVALASPVVKDTPAQAAAAAGTVASATAAAASSLERDAREEKRGVLGKLKDALVADGDAHAANRSRALGSEDASGPAGDTVAADGKLVMAEQAEPRPVTPKPTLEDAKAALNAGDYDTAARMFTTLANDGNAEAQAHIGYMTYQGEGVMRDRAAAVEWYRKSAVQGNRDAQYNLAVAYAFGEGVPQDDGEAANWYRRAAEQGSAIAQYSLGVSYALGEGVTQSDAEAVRFYRMAAEQGYPAAQYNLAYMHRAGKGIDQSDVEALRWFRQAAQNGHASAQYSLGYMYRSGKGVSRDLDEAIRWYRMAAAQGHPEARADLATLEPGG